MILRLQTSSTSRRLIFPFYGLYVGEVSSFSPEPLRVELFAGRLCGRYGVSGGSIRMKSRRIYAGLLCAALIVCAAVCIGSVRAANGPDIPTVDAGIGSCRADFNVKDGSGKPLYNAKINITIKYGFMNMRKAQLESPTNTNGQARFTGLPNFSKKPLEFVITSGTVSKSVTDDPTTNCQAVLNVALSVH